MRCRAPRRPTNWWRGAQRRADQVFTPFTANTPQLFVDIDRVKAQKLGVPMSDGHRHAPDLPRLGLRQRLQHVRPHLPGHRAGRPPFRDERRRHAQSGAHRNAAGDDGPLGSRRGRTSRTRARPRRCATTYPAADCRAIRPGHQFGRPPSNTMKELASETLPSGWRSNGRTVLPAGHRRATPALSCSDLRAVRLPGAGGPVRELVAAARDHPDRADVPAGAIHRRAGCAGWTTTSSRRSGWSCWSGWRPRTRS